MEEKLNKETIDSLKANIQYLMNMSGEFGSILLEELQEVTDYIKTIEDAWVKDETIQEDGSLRPSISNTVKRAAEAEAEVKRLTKKMQEITDNIKIVEDENLSRKPNELPMTDYYQGKPIAIHRNGDVYFNLAGLKIAIDKLYSDENRERRNRGM